MSDDEKIEPGADAAQKEIEELKKRLSRYQDECKSCCGTGKYTYGVGSTPPYGADRIVTDKCPDCNGAGHIPIARVPVGNKRGKGMMDKETANWIIELQTLLICYRIGKHPTGRTLDYLSKMDAKYDVHKKACSLLDSYNLINKGKGVSVTIDNTQDIEKLKNRIAILERALEIACPLFIFETNPIRVEVNYPQKCKFIQQASAELAKESGGE